MCCNNRKNFAKKAFLASFYFDAEMETHKSKVFRKFKGIKDERQGERGLGCEGSEC